ncbi:hypothetical protein M878_09700 [Streptomyces roseochromogenus subsp. oscitans DS 12.976]|uniref:Uncharacterized protein n=1 Tax=Streptomyces roseochromogenus subsp. oscitans DS 12.976 TaxID=1352936 RepID=V6KR12_STRRC|nr:hypothetical protein M878_09700 [Streptomyces roseochromogenus subsp. oscitans DS 12.976]
MPGTTFEAEEDDEDEEDEEDDVGDADDEGEDGTEVGVDAGWATSAVPVDGW